MTASSPESIALRPVVLCILDGWGVRAERDNNAIAQGQTPNWDRFMASVPHAQLMASAEDVGLPAGQMGNSEVGHTTIGSGRRVPQDLPRIDAAIADGTFDTNPALTGLVSKLKASGGTCHVLGLLSPGGVHSHICHVEALIRRVSAAGLPVRVHGFLDGRDVPPQSARDDIAGFLEVIGDLENVDVATISGRYYAMDRDKRWDRVERAYLAIAEAKGAASSDPLSAITASYDADIGDEFVVPSVMDGYKGMADGDGVLFANFRSDRAREILMALVDPDFDAFPRACAVTFAALTGMVEYSSELNTWFDALFPPPVLTNMLGEVVSKAGLKQLRIAETEKYAHVTFFFNGGREDIYPGEDRILVPSPKVATYDLKPEMSAPEMTDRLTDAIEAGGFDIIIANYANGDMVGHTGMLDAAVRAVETVDLCLGRLEQAVRKANGILIVTSDHGNCEHMLAEGQPHTAHTVNPVPVLMINAPAWVETLHDGGLVDIAPTMLHLLGMTPPAEMTGRTLIAERASSSRAAG